jgi:C1A family cysteine protease
VGGQAVHGLTIFSDISQEEFHKVFLTANPSLKRSDRKIATVSANITSDSLVDWTGVYTTPVKDQGYCGSCWAFSATEQIESDAMRTLGTEYVLSPEQIVECDTADSGCRGGERDRL